MKRVLFSVATLGLAGQLALADTSGWPHRGGSSTDAIATTLGLTDDQAAELKRILDADRARMEAARADSSRQVDAELANVLTAEQIAELKTLLRADRGNHCGPPPGPPPSDN